MAPRAHRTRHSLLSFGIFLILGFQVGVWAVQIASLVAALHLEPGALGVALSCGAAGGILSLFAGGVIADRLGRRTVLLIGLIATGASFSLLGLSVTFAEVVCVVLLYGLSSSFIDLGSNAVGSDYEAAHDVQALTGLQAGFSLGAASGALLSALLLAAGTDYRFVYFGLSAVFAIAAVVVAVAEFPPRAPHVPAADGAPAPLRLWRVPGVLFATIIVTVCFFGDGALEGFLSVFLRQTLASGILLSGLGVASYHVASLAGRLLVSRGMRRVSTRTLIVAAGALAATGITVAVLSPAAGLSIGGMLLVGFAISPVIPSALSLTARSAPGRSAQAVALTTATGYSAFLVGPLVIGAVADAAGLRIALGILIATSLLLAALGTRWPAGSARGTAATPLTADR